MKLHNKCLHTSNCVGVFGLTRHELHSTDTYTRAVNRVVFKAFII
jgi:hypothetical protein